MFYILYFIFICYFACRFTFFLLVCLVAPSLCCFVLSCVLSVLFSCRRWQSGKCVFYKRNVATYLSLTIEYMCCMRVWVCAVRKFVCVRCYKPPGDSYIPIRRFNVYTCRSPTVYKYKYRCVYVINGLLFLLLFSFTTNVGLSLCVY